MTHKYSSNHPVLGSRDWCEHYSMPVRVGAGCPDCRQEDLMNERKADMRARKGWNGGKEPELNAEGKALEAHAESCAHCKEHTILFPCDEGRRLYEAFNESLKVPT